MEVKIKSKYPQLSTQTLISLVSKGGMTIVNCYMVAEILNKRVAKAKYT